MALPATQSSAIAFGRFRLVPAQNVLLEGDVPCRLGARAMSILVALVEQAGKTVTKQALLARAWPDAFVHEANLRMHVAALRKVLGSGEGGAPFITNVTGRGLLLRRTRPAR